VSKEQCGWPFSDSATPEALLIRAVYAKRIEEIIFHLIRCVRSPDARASFCPTLALVSLTADCSRAERKDEDAIHVHSTPEASSSPN